MCTGKKRIKVKLCVQEKRIEDVLYLTNFFFLNLHFIVCLEF